MTAPHPEAALSAREAEKTTKEALAEAVTFLEMDDEASKPGTDLYTWLKAVAQPILSTAHTATAGDGGERTWHRDGALLYTLKPHVNQFGRSRGKMVNDVTVRVEGPDADTIATEIHAALAQAPAVQAPAGEESLQARYQVWMDKVCEGDPTDLKERCARAAEEFFELMQALHVPASDLREVMQYTYGRPEGTPFAELGGAISTLAALAEFIGFDMMACGEAELARVDTPAMIAKVRGKRSRRHGRGALPGLEADLIPTPTDAQPKAARLVGDEALREDQPKKSAWDADWDQETPRSPMDPLWSTPPSDHQASRITESSDGAVSDLEKAASAVSALSDLHQQALFIGWVERTTGKKVDLAGLAALASHPTTGQETVATPRDGGVRDQADAAWDGASLETRLRSYPAAPPGSDALSCGYVSGLMTEAADAIAALSAPGSAGPGETQIEAVALGLRWLRGETGACDPNQLRAAASAIEAALATPSPAQEPDTGDTGEAIKKQCAEYGGMPERCLITERNWPSYITPTRCNLCPDAPLLASPLPAQEPRSAGPGEQRPAADPAQIEVSANDELWDAIHEAMVCAWNLLDGTADDASGACQEDWDALAMAMETMRNLVPETEEPFSPSYAVPYLRAALATPATTAETVKGDRA